MDSDSSFVSDEEDFDFDYYYDDDVDFRKQLEADKREADVEYFEYECLNENGAEKILDQSVELLCSVLKLRPALVKLLLHTHKWNATLVIERFAENAEKLFIDSRIEPKSAPNSLDVFESGEPIECAVCYNTPTYSHLRHMQCHHLFCTECWISHFETQIKEGFSTNIECMADKCKILAPEDFVLDILQMSPYRNKYQQMVFQDCIKFHPLLRFCCGANCPTIISAESNKGKKVTCTQCNSTFCFKCGEDYHAPLDCHTMKKWLIKCKEDSANQVYLSTNTKDCPNCNACIEKNGGCNHMHCSTCKHHFCWLCLKSIPDTHDYVSCNQFKGSDTDSQTENRKSIQRYVFYYSRWKAHSSSLELEEKTLEGYKMHCQEQLMEGNGTLIDWECIFDAAKVLAKSRYTMQYTYPYVYYLEDGPRKTLFEYQQAELEEEIEALSFIIERAETTDLRAIKEQLDRLEKRRLTLLRDFLDE